MVELGGAIQHSFDNSLFIIPAILIIALVGKLNCIFDIFHEGSGINRPGAKNILIFSSFDRRVPGMITIEN